MIVRYTALCPMVFGDGAINGVGEEVKALGCTRVLLLSDTITARQPAYATCQNSLLNVGIEVVEYPNCLPDPPDHIVIEASKLANAEKVDGLVAFGGGSVIDTAKAVKVLMNNPLPMAQYYGNYNYKPGVPLTAIPTTAGTGSETTRYAVISDSQLVQKKSFYVHADLGILDPEITASMPPQVTASTGMDAFSHSAEALTSQTANPHSDLLGSDSIRRIVQYLPLAVADGANHQARREMMIASNFAGSAFNDAPTHLGHSIAQTLGAHQHVTHGVACALALPEVMVFAAGIVPEKVRMIGEAMGLSIPRDADNQAIGAQVAKAIRTFMKGIQIPSLKALGLSREDTVKVAPYVFNEASMLRVPDGVSLTEAQMESILGAVYDNYQ